MKHYIHQKQQVFYLVSRACVYLGIFITGSLIGRGFAQANLLRWDLGVALVCFIGLLILKKILGRHIWVIEEMIRKSPYTLWENEKQAYVETSLITAEEAANHLENLEMYYCQTDDMTPKQRKSIKFAIDFLRGAAVKNELFVGSGGS